MITLFTACKHNHLRFRSVCHKFIMANFMKAVGGCLCFFIFYFNVCTRHEAHRKHVHTVCTTQIDNNRHELFVPASGVGPQD